MNKQFEITDATRKSIFEAFWTVYQQKPIDRITIKDISDTAHIHRSTFYRYFTDIYNVLDQFELRILDEISMTRDRIYGNQELYDLLSHADVMVRAMKEYAPIIYRLTGPDGDPAFRGKLRKQMFLYFSRFTYSTEHSLESEYLFNFIFMNILANLNFWYEHRREYTLEQIVELSKTLIGDGIIKYIIR